MGEAGSPSQSQAAELILQSLFLTLNKTLRVQVALKSSQMAVQVCMLDVDSIDLIPSSSICLHGPRSTVEHSAVMSCASFVRKLKTA